MPERVQVANPVAVPGLRPAARPTGAFEDPGPARQPTDGDQLLQLAKGIEAARPGAEGFLQERTETFTREEFAAGVAAFQANRKSFKDAVEAGDIAAGASPHFRRGWKSQALRLKGQEYDLGLRTAYAEAGLSNEDDNGVFAAFVSDFTEQFMAEQLGEFEEIAVAENFLPLVNQSQNNINQSYIADRVRLVEEAVIANTEQEVFGLVDNSYNSADGFNAQSVGSAITQVVNDQVANGLNGKTANRLMVDAIVNKAEVEGDSEILEALNHITTGPGGILGNTAYARQQRERAEDAIASAEISGMRFAAWQRDQANDARRDALMSAAFQALEDSPFNDITAIEQQLAGFDPVARASLLSYQTSLKNERVKVRENPLEIASLYNDLNVGSEAPVTVIAKAAAQGSISSNTVVEMFNYANRNRDGASYINSRTFKQAEGALNRLVGGGDLGGDPRSKFRAQMASVELREATHDWMAENARPDGSFSQREFQKFLDEEFVRLTTSPRFEVDVGVEDFAEQAKAEAEAAAEDAAPLAQPAGEAPTQAAIEHLRRNPETWRDFEAAFPGYKSSDYFGTQESIDGGESVPSVPQPRGSGGSTARRPAGNADPGIGF
jgi:hypothetical protein